MANLTPTEFVAKYDSYAQALADYFGLSKNLFLAQFAVETGWGSSYQAEVDLNLAGINYNGIACTQGEGGFAKYATLDNFVTGYKNVLSLNYYSAVRGSKGKPFDTQAIALGNSPWAASHYDNGNGPGSILIEVAKLLPNSTVPTTGTSDTGDVSLNGAGLTAKINELSHNQIERYDDIVKSTYVTNAHLADVVKSIQVDLDNQRTELAKLTGTSKTLTTDTATLTRELSLDVSGLITAASELQSKVSALSTSTASQLATLTDEVAKGLGTLYNQIVALQNKMNALNTAFVSAPAATANTAFVSAATYGTPTAIRNIAVEQSGPLVASNPVAEVPPSVPTSTTTG